MKGLGGSVVVAIKVGVRGSGWVRVLGCCSAVR